MSRLYFVEHDTTQTQPTNLELDQRIGSDRDLLDMGGLGMGDHGPDRTCNLRRTVCSLILAGMVI